MTKPETSTFNNLIRSDYLPINVTNKPDISDKALTTFVWLIENSTEYKVINVLDYLATSELETFLYAIDSCGNPDLADNLVPIECDLIMTLQDL
mgnify:CR=1 FL=1